MREEGFTAIGQRRSKYRLVAWFADALPGCCFHLLGLSDVAFQCLDRHSKHVRRTSHDSAQIRKAQETERTLVEEKQTLEKAVTKLRRDLAAEKKTTSKNVKNIQSKVEKTTFGVLSM